MKKIMKGFASLLLIAILILGVSVLAKAEPTEKITYDCGKKATWFYDKSTSTLTISGKGTVTGNDAWYSIKPKKVVIKKGITRIGYGAFEELDTVKEVSIPETVKEIENWAFARTGIKTITIGEHIKYVGYDAFAFCRSLVSVTWEAKDVAEEAFYGCKKLSEIKLGKNVKTIGSYAFNGTGIEEFEVPDNVNKVYSNAFRKCKKLKTLKLSKNMKVVPEYIAPKTPELKTIVVKEGTTTINKNAFTDSGAVEIKLPESIDDIKSYAFSGAENVKSVMVPGKIKTIKDGTFKDCKKLEKVEIGNGVTSIGEEAFKGCKALKDVVIPNNVTNIGYAAFENTGCEKVSIGNGVSFIDYWAFNNCNQLKTVSIGAKVGFVAENAFSNCNSLTVIAVDEKNSTYASKYGCLTDKKGTTLMTVPAGKSGVFEMPSGISNLETTAFYGCNKITSYASTNNENFKATDGILYNKYMTVLYTCPPSKTGTINIPNTVKVIKESAFQHSQASSIIIPNSVTSIGYCAFEYCNNLTTMNIPGSVKKISNDILGV